MKEINKVCTECGVTANVLTCLLRYQNRPNKLAFDVSTSNKGICDYCGEERLITSERDYFYPDFSLIEKVIPLLQKLEFEEIDRKLDKLLEDEPVVEDDFLENAKKVLERYEAGMVCAGVRANDVVYDILAKNRNLRWSELEDLLHRYKAHILQQRDRETPDLFQESASSLLRRLKSGGVVELYWRNMEDGTYTVKFY